MLVSHIFEEDNRKYEAKKEQEAKNKLLNLVVTFPSELWVYIFSFLLPSEILVVRLVCRNWCNIGSDNNLWQLFHTVPIQKKTFLSHKTCFLAYYRNIHYEKLKHNEMEDLVTKINTLKEKQEYIHKKSKEEREQKWKDPNEPRTCKFCSKEYLEIFNKNPICFNHPGIYNYSIQEWSCCEGSKTTKGCRRTKHQPDW